MVRTSKSAKRAKPTSSKASAKKRAAARGKRAAPRSAKAQPSRKKAGKQPGVKRTTKKGKASSKPAARQTTAKNASSARKQASTAPQAKPKAVKAPQRKAEKPRVESARSSKRAAKAALRRAPDFELNDQAGRLVSSRELAGSPYVLYFYPKDNTPGCTTEACAFRDLHPDFSKLGLRVFGVSADSERSHAGFASKYQLPFSLLADPDKILISAYGVWVQKQNYGRQYMGIERSTFLVDGSGNIKQSWRSVKVNGHAEAVLQSARELG